jgi:predicted  nucleic acid-binding Zn-ribbon protein
MKSLNTLIRLKQREMDALKRQQGLLENQREEVHRIIEALGNQLVTERKAAEKMPELAHFFGDFSATIKKRQEQMHTHLRKVEAELERINAQLREKFSEMKKFDLALAGFNTREAEKLRKRDAAEMDEVGLRGYTRRDAS